MGNRRLEQQLSEGLDLEVLTGKSLPRNTYKATGSTTTSIVEGLPWVRTR